MNITFFTPTFKLSGGNIVMFKYAETLAELGYNVTVIAPHNEIINEVRNGVHIKTFRKINNRYFEHIFFQLIYLKKFYELTPASDVIIPIFFPLVIHAIYCKKRGKTKKIISLFQDFKEMFWFGNYISFLLRLKFITDQVSMFIAVSNPIANYLKKYTNKNIIVIPNGIEHKYFYPRDNKKENYILFIGSSSKMKGLKYFLKAFELVQKEYPNIHAKIVSHTDTYNMNPNIEFINTTNDKNLLAELYSNALIYVSQSLGDSFGLPPLEAMACGTAVVLTNTVGSNEYAKDGENCFVVPTKNPTQTANAILKILMDENIRKHFENNGMKTAHKYSWEFLNKKLEDIEKW